MQASEILGFDDLKTKVVTVKQWKCKLTIRELGLDEGLRLFGQVVDNKVTVNAEQIAQIVAWGVVDSDGERVFSDEDVPALMKKSKAALVFLYGEITKLSTGDAGKN